MSVYITQNPSKKGRKNSDKNTYEMIYDPDSYPYYTLSEASEFDDQLPKRCADFVRTADIDPFNGSYMDPLIEQNGRLDIESYRKQRIDHIRALMNDDRQRNGAKKIEIEYKMALWEKRKEDTHKELERFNRIIRKGTSLEE